MIRPTVAAPVALLLVLTGCGGGSEPGTVAKPSPSDATQPSTPNSDEGRLALESGVSVFYRCVGRGSPAILLEAGGGAGTQEFGSSFLDPLAKATKVCAYDRLGVGSSDPAPARHRTVEDHKSTDQSLVRRLPGVGHVSTPSVSKLPRQRSITTGRPSRHSNVRSTADPSAFGCLKPGKI